MRFILCCCRRPPHTTVYKALSEYSAPQEQPRPLPQRPALGPVPGSPPTAASARHGQGVAPYTPRRVNMRQ